MSFIVMNVSKGEFCIFEMLPGGAPGASNIYPWIDKSYRNENKISDHDLRMRRRNYSLRRQTNEVFSKQGSV